MSGSAPEEVPNPAAITSAAGSPAEATPSIGVGGVAAPVPAAGDVSPAAIPAVEAAPAIPEPEPSLLQSFEADEKKAAEAAKVAEAEKKPDGEKKDAAAPAEGETAKVEVPPVDYQFSTPEGMSLSSEQGNELKSALDAFRADPTKGAQGLIDLHAKAIRDYDANTLVRQHETFNNTRKDWRQQVVSDEQLGGSGHQTTMRAIARMRDRFVPEKNRAAFDSFLMVTGAGDHPEFLRLLHNVAGAFDEPTLPPPNAKPLRDIGRNPAASKATILYGKA